MDDECVNWYKEGLRKVALKYSPGGVTAGALDYIKVTMRGLINDWCNSSTLWVGGQASDHYDQLDAVWQTIQIRIGDYQDTVSARIGGQPDTVREDDWRARFDGHRPTMMW